MHALLACSGAEMPTGIENFRQLARFHYTQAVAGLRGALNDNNLERQWVVSMLTIMMLCIYEVMIFYRLLDFRDSLTFLHSARKTEWISGGGNPPGRRSKANRILFWQIPQEML